MSRDKHIKQSLGYLTKKIKESRILLVGAGGIGCELLKNLVLSGFGRICIVDLDTIDLSNLNRQFLFRHEHIKKSKALVAKDAAAKFNSQVKLEAHHANIKDPQFTVDWFTEFDLVFNALDNLDARRHVNKMCLAAMVPLIESGTTGFNGQVQVIKKGITECYDCNPKQTPKTFPVCTIRSTPSQPIHCIVWAKSYLFTEVFGTSEEDVPELDGTQNAENAQELENLRQEAQALKKIRESLVSDDLARRIFEKVFTHDIDRLRSMEDMWKTRKAPTSLSFDSVMEGPDLPKDDDIAKQDQKVWSMTENAAVFCQSVAKLSRRFQDMQTSGHTNGTNDSDSGAVLTFDKDDEDTLDFVASSANLRSHIFDIPAKSKFEIKQMAGNIIPAIATTNAMTAGLCVLQAFKVLQGDYENARMIFLERSGARAINSDKLNPPNPTCAVCSVAQARVEIDLERATMKDLVETTIRQELAYVEDFSVTNEVGVLFDPDLDDNLPRTLKSLGVVSGSFLTVLDDSESSPRVNLSLAIKHKTFAPGEATIQILSKPEIPLKVEPVVAPEDDVLRDVHQNSNGFVPPTSELVNVEPSNGDTSSKDKLPTSKRKRDSGNAEMMESVSTKKGRVQTAESDLDVVVLDDAKDETIVIDD